MNRWRDEQLCDEVSAGWSLWLRWIGQDIRYAFRLFRKDLAFAVPAVLVLAIGIGANVALFSVINAVMLRPLPYRDADQLVALWKWRFPGGGLSASPADFFAWREQSRSFRGMAAYVHQTAIVSGDGKPDEIELVRATPNLLLLLGITPIRGRGFLPEDAEPVANGVVLVTHRLWHKRWNGRMDVLGAKLKLNGEACTVVGILPPSFVFGDKLLDVVAPLPLDRGRPVGNSLSVLARLRPGVTPEQAEAEVRVITARLSAEAANGSRLKPSVVPLWTDTVDDAKSLLVPLSGAVGCVLLIGCTTLATLVLARASSRRSEMAVRIALGAGRKRVLGQMLTENVVLALLGGLLGLAVTALLVPLLISARPKGVPRVDELDIDTHVLLFTLAVSILTGILFGLAPALWTSQVNVEAALKEESRGAAGRSRHWLRNGLVVAEVALSFVLLIGAGLLLNSFVRLITVDPGFRADHVLTMRVTLPEYAYNNMQRIDSFYEQLVERVKSLSGIVNAGISTFLPLARGVMHVSFTFREGPPYELGDGPDKGWEVRAIYYVSPDYLATLHTRILRGRGFTTRDNQLGAPPAAIVNHTFAQEFFPNENPIGKQIRMSYGNLRCTIVGVSDDMKNGGLGDDQLWLSKPPFGTIYVPHVFREADLLRPENGNIGRTMYLVVRTTGEPLRMVDAIRHTVWSIDPNQPVAEVKTMDERLMDSVASRRLGMLPFVIFAGVALFLAAGGIYGLVAYTVAQRTREIGVRIALGAVRTDILLLMMRHTLGLALLGVMAGLVGAHWLTRALESQLYAITRSDAFTYVAVIVVLLGAVAGASYFPARRAATLDPFVALRHT